MSNNDFHEHYTKHFIGTNLRRLRESFNLTSQEVADVIGKSRQGYIHYEKGEREIRVKDLITLSGFYNVPIDVLVANPFTLSNDKTLMFRSFEVIDNKITEVMPFTISTIHDDVICFKSDTDTIQFFWKSMVNVDHQLMLFDYYDNTYISKVYFKSTGGGHFYINDEPKYFNKVNAEHLIFKGVYMGELNKHIHVKNFFNTRS